MEADREKQQEDLRNALLAAADEEGAAIVEQARRDITLAVRRARRDLHLIRAQLHLCGVEAPPLPLTAPPVEPDANSLGDGVPQDAIAVGPTNALRHVVTEASLELAQLSTPVHPPAPANDTVAVDIPVPSPRRVGRSSVLVITCVLGLLVAGGAAGWLYSQRDSPSVLGQDTPTAATPGDAADRSTSARVLDAAGPDAAAAAKTESSSVPTSRIVLRTIRPVWMRINLDGNRDVGRMYPEGTIEELTPTHDAVIRVGDAGAVLLGVGGTPPTPFGQAGQALTRRIAVDEPSTPRPSVQAGDTRPPAAPAVAAPATAAETTATADQQHGEILAKHERWLTAFVRGDRQSLRALTAESYSLRDERSASETNSPTASPPQVSDIQIDVAGVGAVLTGRLRTVIDGVPKESVLSEVWVRNSQQQWALMGVRITPTASVGSDRPASLSSPPAQ